MRVIGFFLIYFCVFNVWGNAVKDLGLEQVSLLLDSESHGYEFAGFYAAEMKGFYEEAGLQVEFRAAKSDVNLADEVVSGRATYGIGSTWLLNARQKGKPVFVLATLFQHSPEVFVTLKSSGIKSLDDFYGKRIYLPSQPDYLMAYLHKMAIDPSVFATVSDYHGVDDLISGKVDVVGGYITDITYKLEQLKIPYRVFLPVDAGLDFYGDSLFTSESEFLYHPQRSKAFREATIKGWQYAFQHPEEVIAYISQYYAPKLSLDELRYQARILNKYLGSEETEPGYIYKKRWELIAENYKTLGLLAKDFSIDGLLYRVDQDKVDIEEYHTSITMIIFLIIFFLVISAILVVLLLKLKYQQKQQMMLYEKLEKSEQNFRFMTDNTADVIWSMDIASGRQTYISPSIYNLLGYMPEEIINQPYESTMTSESAANFFAQLSEAIERWNQGTLTDIRQVMEVDRVHKDGHLVYTEVVTTLHFNSEGNPVSLIGITRDITERKKAENEIRSMAFKDPLTQLPNRRFLIDELQRILGQVTNRPKHMALLFIDLDHFKPVNDQYGHEIGDWLLIEVGKRMQLNVRSSDIVARIGGDEFIIFLPIISDENNAITIAQKIKDNLIMPFMIQDGTKIQISCSIGIAIFPDHGDTANTLLKKGDLAMYFAKASGKNKIQVYQDSQADNVTDKDIQMRLFWKKGYECGISQIDEEHKELFRLTSEVISEMMHKEITPVEFQNKFAEFMAHIQNHFEHEEKILSDCEYQELQQHKEIHKNLVARANTLYSDVIKNKITVGLLIDFMIEELVRGHILKEDRKFFYLFRNREKSFNGMDI